jgi:peptidoglycan hydrolase-like protein with peptidoglycan-binding domain
VKKRLSDLGYGTDNMSEALKAFQAKQKLEVSGNIDDATRARLKEIFGQ